jgi:transcription initiation factor TFIID TATA-box-binding protein
MQVASSSSGPEKSVQEEGISIPITITNVVATMNLGVQIDLEKVQQTVSNAEYNPRRFGAVILRIRRPRATALVFKSGKVVVTGPKDIKDSQEAAQIFTAIIRKVGFDGACREYKIQNMSAMCDVGFPIRLEKFLHEHPTQSTYEPELFPGLIYRMVEPKIVLLVFVSGKVVITGAKAEESLARAITNLYPHLVQNRKKGNLELRRING